MIKKILSIFKDSSDSFEGQEEGEQVLLLLRRHIFVVLLALSGFALVSLVPVLIATIFSSYIVRSGLLSLFLFASSIWYLFLWLAIFHFLTMYTLNTVTITDRRIIDKDQHGFFNQKVSELHVNRIQDVTVHTKGILETLLHFGKIIVQTAASEKQFIFHQIPDPEKVKDVIMQAIASKKPEMRSI